MTEEQKILLNKYVETARVIGHTHQGVKGLKVRNYKYFEYLNDASLDVYRVKVQDALSYQKWLLNAKTKDGKKYNTSTIASYMNAASNFNNYLKNEKHIYSNPFLQIKKLRGRTLLPRLVFKEKEMNQLLTALSDFDEYEGNLVSKITAYKIHVVCELLYATGLRSSEAASLKANDIDFDKGIVRVIEGKQGISRIALLDDYAKNILKIYVEQMKDLVSNVWNKKNNTLFGIGYERFNSIINHVLSDTCKRSGLKKFTSHSFRHSLGYHLLRSGADIRHIQAILGHKKLSSTEIYTKVDKEDLCEVFNKYHPRQFKGVKDESVNL